MSKPLLIKQCVKPFAGLVIVGFSLAVFILIEVLWVHWEQLSAKAVASIMLTIVLGMVGVVFGARVLKRKEEVKSPSDEGKYYATYRLWLIERGTLEEYLSSPVNVKKVELIKSITTALKHLGEPYDAAARRQWIERAGYHELLLRYQSDERSDVADLENLAWLASMDAGYLEAFFAGPFLDEPVVVYQEANLTRIESALCKECA